MQGGIHDRFVEKLSRAMDAELRVGHGSEPDTTQGPLINSRAAEKVETKMTSAQLMLTDQLMCRPLSNRKSLLVRSFLVLAFSN